MTAVMSDVAWSVSIYGCIALVLHLNFRSTLPLFILHYAKLSTQIKSFGKEVYC